MLYHFIKMFKKKELFCLIDKEIFPKMIGRKIFQAQRIREDSDYDGGQKYYSFFRLKDKN